MSRQYLDFRLDRLPKDLQGKFNDLYSDKETVLRTTLNADDVYQGDARHLLKLVAANSVAVSVWSPPYWVGKSYEENLSFDDWQELLSTVIAEHFRVIKPGGFLVINIADILCFKDIEMPRVQADVIHRKKVALTREEILSVLKKNPGLTRYDLAAHFGCSEQTIDRRLHGNNIRGGKHQTQTRVKIVGGLVEDWALAGGFYPYDRRIWVKDAAWENSRWASLSYRAVDEFEYIYIFWKPGITKYDRSRLSSDEWKNWGSRAVWHFNSVRANDDHEAKFPVELPVRIIRLFSDPGELILDCFLGSGSSAIAAIREQRKFIGIEIDPDAVSLAKNLIRRELENPGLFNAH
ncbi:MAG: DNA methyltransferase [Pyrinomonadaceae bacterium]